VYIENSLPGKGNMCYWMTMSVKMTGHRNSWNCVCCWAYVHGFDTEETSFSLSL